MKQKSKTLNLILSILFLLATAGIVQFYIWGNTFITEFQSDCTDTLLWAQASIESGTLFKPTFDYAYRLAFGGQWLFIPFIKHYGLGMTALRAGMCLFSVLFTSALVFFFRAQLCRWSASFFYSALMLLSVCATKKTREIFFGHIIHYSLAVLYLLLVFILLRLVLKQDSRRKRIFPMVLLTICLFMCSGNGTVQMLYVILPLLAGCLIEAYLTDEKDLTGICLCICIAAGAGFLFSRSLNTNYTDNYSVIVPADDWAENLLSFPKRWISLFYTLPGEKINSFSALWIKTVFKSITALLMLAGLMLSFSRYKTISDRECRIFIFTTWAMFAAFLYFFVFGKISDVDWRLIPLLFSAQTVILILLNRLFPAFPERTLSGGFTLLCGIILVLNAFSNGLSVLRISYDEKIWFAEDGLLETLKAHDLNEGYITSYWLSNSVTVLSGNKVCPRFAAWGEEGPYLLPFNSDMEWYNDRPDCSRYFLAVKESQYDPEMELAKEASETYFCFQEDTRNSIKENYVIMVHDHNIMKSEYDKLIDRYR